MSRARCKIDHFELSKIPDYSSQYFKTYSTRLNCQNIILEKLVFEKYGPDANLKKLSDLVPDEKCVVIGTIYKDMGNHPSVIKEYAEAEEAMIPKIVSHKLTSPQDVLFLEESQQRIQLDSNSVDVSRHVTGISVAVFGYESEDVKAKFVVEDIIFPTPQFPLLKGVDAAECSARYIAIISGMQMSGDEDNVVLIKLFFDWLSGLVPLRDLRVDPRSVGRLVVAGDSMREDGEDKLLSENKFMIKRSEVNSLACLSLLDQLLCGVSQSIPVDIMPGVQDPTSILVPQLPMNDCMFPHSSKWASFQSRPNPWLFYLSDGGLAIGSSGQNIDDIDRYADLGDPLDRLQATIKWGHVAPTAPDTVPSYPNNGIIDPLIMPHAPSLYFAGNQDRFSWRNVPHGDRSTLLVTVPRFCETGQVVLVDVINKRCESLIFK